MSTKRSADYKKHRKILLDENERCELCGCRRGLEVHHIIPFVYCHDDSIDNLIVVCTGCHAKLTPRSTLTKQGMHRASYEPNVNVARFCHLLSATDNTDINWFFNTLFYAAGMCDDEHRGEYCDCDWEILRKFEEEARQNGERWAE